MGEHKTEANFPVYSMYIAMIFVRIARVIALASLFKAILLILIQFVSRQ